MRRLIITKHEVEHTVYSPEEFIWLAKNNSPYECFSEPRNLLIFSSSTLLQVFISRSIVSSAPACPLHFLLIASRISIPFLLPLLLPRPFCCYKSSNCFYFLPLPSVSRSDFFFSVSSRTGEGK